MGKRGPQPAPTALRLLRGEVHKDRINTREPVPPEGDTSSPLRALSPDAQRVWDHLRPTLEAMHVLTVADLLLLGVLCEQVATYWRARELLDASDLLLTNERGRVVRNPALQAQRDAAYLVRMLCQEFGLSPAARAQIQAGHTGDVDERERYFA